MTALLTLAESSIRELPRHTCKLLNYLLRTHPNHTQYDLFNALLLSCASEVGFIGDWNSISLDAYCLNTRYSVERNLIEDVATWPPAYQFTNAYNRFKFRFCHKMDREVMVYSLDSGEMILLTGQLIDNSIIQVGSSTTVSLPRFVPYKHLNLNSLPASFRNLRELSMKLKNQLFLPLRNEIFSEMNCTSPSLAGIDEDMIRVILKKLKRKDIISLASTCKTIRLVCIPYLMHNKTKKDWELNIK